MYTPVLDQIQFGKQTVFGTAVSGSAKAMLVDECTLEPEVTITNLPDIRGSLAPAYVTTLDSHLGGASLSGTATYEDLPYMLDGIFATATPSGANPYVYAYTGALGSIPTRRIFTLIKGQTGGIQKLTGGVLTELTVKIESNKPWTYSAKFIGQKVDDGTLAALSDRTVVPIHANVTTMYLDAVGGTIGSTAVTTVWFSAELTIKNEAALVPSVGNLSPTTFVEGRNMATLKVEMDVDATTGGYLTSILGSGLLQKQIRFKATTGASAIAQLDFAGTFSKAPAISDDKDGVRTYNFELEAAYNSTLTNWAAASVTNAVSALP